MSSQLTWYSILWNECPGLLFRQRTTGLSKPIPIILIVLLQTLSQRSKETIEGHLRETSKILAVTGNSRAVP